MTHGGATGGRTFGARGLGCIRGDAPVFAGVDLTLAPGGAMLVRGPNGAGKSSLLRVLAGLLPPAAGGLTWNGATLAPGDDAHRALVGYLGHADALKPVLTARENLSLWADLRGARRTAVDAALAALGLDHLADTPVQLFSAGQQRRLALARLTATAAPVWLLDEPAVSLDREARERLAAVLADHRAAGGRVVVATHQALDLPEAAVLDMAEHAPAPVPPEAVP